MLGVWVGMLGWGWGFRYGELFCTGGYSQSQGWVSPSPLIPLPSRERGIRLCWLVSPVPPCGLRIKSAMTGRGYVVIVVSSSHVCMLSFCVVYVRSI